MADEQKSPAIAAAEAKLKALEHFDHDVADARTALRAAEMTADPKRIAAAQAVYDAAVEAKAKSGVTDDQIAQASQAVLDARGESHSEENILPPDLGLRTVEADAALADALGRRNAKQVEAARSKLEDAISLDAAEKADHVAASHERTLAKIEGAKS